MLALVKAGNLVLEHAIERSGGSFL